MTEQAPVSRPKRPKQPIPRRFWFQFALFLVVMIAATFGVFWYNVIQTYHLAPVQIGVLYRDGNRDLRELKHAINLTHAKTIVSLIDDNELNDPKKPQFLAETNWAPGNVQYIRIPIKLGGWPSSDDIQTFLKIAQKEENQPVLLHCAQGVRRTGMFVAAFQESVQKMTPRQAKDAIESFGHKETDTDDVRKFIDAYDPIKETVPVMNGPENE